ncbi:MAG: NADH-quinone oxidoreductase subunit L [Acidimicrobiia bacterium]|nr:NADH-quinone oxidoreductase subunit L [Acidimicrobiia bacterium]
MVTAALIGGVSILAAGGEAVERSDGGMLAAGAWLIVLVPFLAALAITLFGKRMPRHGAELAVGAVAFVAVYGTVLLAATTMGDGIVYEGAIKIGEFGGFDIEWAWVVDGLSIMMFFAVGVVSTACFVYAVGYLEGDVRPTAFFASFTLFAGAMLMLVSAANLIQLLIGWELVGVSSYLLIGHYWEEKENSSAGMKAFIVNKIADIGLMIGIIIAAITVGSFTISTIMEKVVESDAALDDVAVVIAVLLFIGAMGKSAQFPFHVWLPDAMAGPTPVSALMHAATMVTAGVYLTARMFPLFEEMAHEALDLVLVIGAITLVIAGWLAIVQDDIKRVLAYSTLSQLGYMVAALGAGAYTAGLFHLFTHAFFKSLLFLGAGSVIHAVHSNNMSDMGGLRKDMPRTFWTFIIGSLALAGIPLFAGFFSKDEILAAFNEGGHPVVFWLGVGTAFVTALYMTRAVSLTFFGEYKGDGHPHESPAIMTVPMLGLAVGAAVFGFLNVPGITDFFYKLVITRGVSAELLGEHATSFDFFALLMGLSAGILGIALGYRLYYQDAATQQERDRLRIPGLWPVLENKYYIDDLYMNGIVNPIKGPLARFINWTNSYIIDFVVNLVGAVTRGLGRFVYGGLDQRGIDLAINEAGAGAGFLGGKLRFIQTGKVQQYATVLFGGTLVLVIGFWISIT